MLCVSGLLRCHFLLSLLHSGSRGIAVFGFKVIEKVFCSGLGSLCLGFENFGFRVLFQVFVLGSVGYLTSSPGMTRTNFPPPNDNSRRIEA